MKKALVLSLVAVLCLGAASFAQTLSGKWNTTVTIVPSPVSLSLSSDLIVTYSISGWSFTSDTLLLSAGWNAQKFDVVGTLGAFTISSDLAFDPSSLAMIQWVTSTELSLAGVDLTAKFVSVPGDTALLLTGKGTAGNVDVSATLKLGTAWFDTDYVGVYCVAPNYTQYWYPAVDNYDGCGFDFNSIDITASFPFCCADVTAEVYFTCAGFQYADFGVTGIQVPNLPWFSFDADVHFTTQTKTIVLTPVFNFGNDACFNLYISQDVLELDPVTGTVTVPGPFTLGNISLNGIDFTCTLGGVTFYDISYWAPVAPADKPGILYNTNYWEAFKLTTSDDACCGPFSFSLTMYFLQGGTQLFDISKVVASMSLQVAQQFKFTTGITMNMDTTPSFTQWKLGFIVTW